MINRQILTSIICFVLFGLLIISTEVSESRENLADLRKRPAAIPDVLVSIDPEKDSKYIILIEKATQQLFLYAYGGKFRKLYRMNCSTGKVSGDKLLSGDMKTPEGVYFFTKQFPKKDLAPRYGTRAYPTDYPNFLDRAVGRKGYSIWLHGTNKPLKARDSNGCIALENSDIDKLAKYITINRTPIIIVDKLSYRPLESQNKVAKSISSFISQWNRALENGTYHEYLKFYDAEYLPDISWWPDWSKARKTFQTSHLPFSVELKRTSIFKHKKVYVIVFDQIVGSSSQNLYAGTRKLYLSNKSDQFRIIGEEYLALPNEPKDKNPESPLVATCRHLKGLSKEDREIPDMIDGWLKAWSSKDIKRYGKYYASNFRSQGEASLKNWLKYKKRLNRKYDYIRVSRIIWLLIRIKIGTRLLLYRLMNPMTSKL